MTYDEFYRLCGLWCQGTVAWLQCKPESVHSRLSGITGHLCMPWAPAGSNVRSTELAGKFAWTSRELHAVCEPSPDTRL